jgi:hypothetical protein
MERTQQNREARAKKLVEDAKDQQRLEAMETPWNRILALYLLPRAPTSDVMYNMSRNIPSGQKLDMVKVASHPKWIPYDDELYVTPKRRGIFAWLQVAVYLSIAVLAYYGMWTRTESYNIYGVLLPGYNGSIADNLCQHKQYRRNINLSKRDICTWDRQILQELLDAADILSWIIGPAHNGLVCRILQRA